MKDNIPTIINDRILHFEQEVKKYFTFLSDYVYTIDKIEKGRSVNFLDYFCNLKFKSDETSISINFSTDIIEGHTSAFPKSDQRPVIDSIVSCSISDLKALMIVSSFIETKHPEFKLEALNIRLDQTDVKSEVTKVVFNYSEIFKNNLVEVLKKEKMYNCYTDRFYDKFFEEINYIHK
ncbi:MAG: hypothetical protein JNM51_16610 [Bacteroidia bacterium]|nr:hypothetical protein [Bacteroidia bacterium]